MQSSRNKYNSRFFIYYFSEIIALFAKICYYIVRFRNNAEKECRYESFHKGTLCPQNAFGFGRTSRLRGRCAERHCRQTKDLQKIFGADHPPFKPIGHFENNPRFARRLSIGTITRQIYRWRYFAFNGRLIVSRFLR